MIPKTTLYLVFVYFLFHAVSENLKQYCELSLLITANIERYNGDCSDMFVCLNMQSLAYPGVTTYFQFQPIANGFYDINWWTRPNV